MLGARIPSPEAQLLLSPGRSSKVASSASLALTVAAMTLPSLRITRIRIIQSSVSAARPSSLRSFSHSKDCTMLFYLEAGIVYYKPQNEPKSVRARYAHLPSQTSIPINRDKQGKYGVSTQRRILVDEGIYLFGSNTGFIRLYHSINTEILPRDNR